MGFLNGIFNYALIFIGMSAVAVGSVFLGKFLRDKKDQKDQTKN